jgi:N-acetylmuramic acid 6-phosphate etherase
MKAGTATKLFLNMLSTGAMVRLGKTYGNFMVDLQPKSAKLRDRAVRILSNLTQLPEDLARRRLQEAQGNLKVALVMEMCGVGPGAAHELLASCNGVVREAVRNRTDNESSK